MKKPKLRSYVLFKNKREVEPYILSSIPRRQRSLVAQIRFGILPLAIETGRFTGQKVEERLCKFCDNGVTESETHFLFECNLYAHDRDFWFQDCIVKNANFMNLSNKEKFILIMSQTFIKQTAFFIEKFWNSRRKKKCKR